MKRREARSLQAPLLQLVWCEWANKLYQVQELLFSGLNKPEFSQGWADKCSQWCPGTPAPPAGFSSGFLQLPEPSGQTGWRVLHFGSNDPTCSPMGTPVPGLPASSGLPEQCWALRADISRALRKERQEPPSCNSTDKKDQTRSACPRSGSRLGGGGNRLWDEGSLLCFSSYIYINGLHFLQMYQSWL